MNSRTDLNTHLLLLGLVLNELLLLLENLETLLVGSLVARNMKLSLANERLGQAGQSGNETAHDVVALVVKVEGTGQNKEDTGNLVRVVEVDPLLELLAETSRRHALETNTARLAGVLELLGRERVDTLGVDHHVVDTNLLETAADLVLEEVVGTEGVDVHVLAHRDELGAGQVVEGDVRVEELGDLDDVLVRGSLTSGTDLGVRQRRES